MFWFCMLVNILSLPLRAFLRLGWVSFEHNVVAGLLGLLHSSFLVSLRRFGVNIHGYSKRQC